jgi:hypothetical protein
MIWRQKNLLPFSSPRAAPEAPNPSPSPTLSAYPPHLAATTDTPRKAHRLRQDGGGEDFGAQRASENKATASDGEATPDQWRAMLVGGRRLLWPRGR